MSGPGDDSGEFHAVVSEQIEANRKSIDRLTEENRLLRDAVARLLGHGPPDDSGDEVAAARRRKAERHGRRHAGIIVVPVALGVLLRHALTASRGARWALAATAGLSAATIAGGMLLAVDNDPYHPRPVHSSPAAAPFSPAAAPAVIAHPPSPGRQSHHPRPGKSGTAAPSSEGHSPPQVSRSRAAVPPSPWLTTPPPAVPWVLPDQVPSPGHSHEPVPAATHLPPPGHEHAPGWLKHQLPVPFVTLPSLP